MNPFVVAYQSENWSHHMKGYKADELWNNDSLGKACMNATNTNFLAEEESWGTEREAVSASTEANDGLDQTLWPTKVGWGSRDVERAKGIGIICMFDEARGVSTKVGGVAIVWTMGFGCLSWRLCQFNTLVQPFGPTLSPLIGIIEVEEEGVLATLALNLSSMRGQSFILWATNSQW